MRADLEEVVRVELSVDETEELMTFLSESDPKDESRVATDLYNALGEALTGNEGED